MTDQNPLVSIIIPTYNRAHLIGETLDSIIAQTYANWECIVVDDGSTDKTRELMVDYLTMDSRFHYHLRPEDRLPGGNAARNYGFEMSKGEYIQWFDDDDIMLPRFLESKVLIISEGINLIICPVTYWDPKTNFKNHKKINIRNSLYEDYLCWEIKVMTPSVLFRKSFLDNKELFSDRIIRGQETELFLRLFYNLKKDSYKVLEQPLVLYRQHDKTKSQRNKVYVPEFMNSTYTIYLENFLRIENGENTRASTFCYQHLLGIFYHSIHNGDIPLAKKMIKEFFSILQKKDSIKGCEMIMVGRIFIFFKRGRWIFIKRWKKFEFE